MTRTTDKIQRWKKVGGGSLRISNKIIKPGQIIEVRESEIPMAFRDLLIPLEDAVEEQDRPAQGDTPEVKEEEKKPSVFSAKHKGGGRFNVVDQDDKVMNEEFLTKVEALELIEKLA